VRTEFSPSPQETLRLVGLHYRQPRNLLLRFGNDALDQSRRLIGVLQQRPDDASTLVERPGDHLTQPAPACARTCWGPGPMTRPGSGRSTGWPINCWIGGATYPTSTSFQVLVDSSLASTDRLMLPSLPG